MKIDKNNYEAFLLDYIEGNLSAEMTAELMLFLQQNPEIESGIEDFKIISLEKEESKFDAKNELKRKEFIVSDDAIEGLIVSLVNGDLNKTEEKKLMEIISSNPDYVKLLAQYKKTRLEKENDILTDKVLLKGNLPVTEENAEYFIIAELEGVINSEEKESLNAFRNAYPGVKNISLAYSATKLDSKEVFVFENKSSLKKKEGVLISFAAVLRYSTIAAAACLILYFGFFTGNNDSNSKSSFADMKETVEKFNSEPNIAEINENPSGLQPSPQPFEDLRDQDELKKETNSNNSIQNYTKKNNDVLIVKEEKKNTDIIPKNPILDNKEDENIHFNREENVNLMAREEIKEIKNEDNNVLANATNTNLSSVNEDDFISPGQYVRNWAKKTFFTEVAESKETDNTTLADNSIQLKGTNAIINNVEKKDYKEYGFSIGKFGFKRKVRK